MVQSNNTVRQGCRLSPTFFNSFLKKVMSDDLEEHDGKIGIGSKTITNLRLTDNIYTVPEEEQEEEAPAESLNKTCTRMDISAKKTNDKQYSSIQREHKVEGQKLGTVMSFKYLGAFVLYEGIKPEILSRIAQVIAALTKLKPIWSTGACSLDLDT